MLFFRAEIILAGAVDYVATYFQPWQDFVIEAELELVIRDAGNIIARRNLNLVGVGVGGRVVRR